MNAVHQTNSFEQAVYGLELARIDDLDAEREAIARWRDRELRHLHRRNARVYAPRSSNPAIRLLRRIYRWL